MPVAVRLFFCDTDFTAVEQNERLFDGFAYFAARGRVDTVALVKSLFDCLLKEARSGLVMSSGLREAGGRRSMNAARVSGN